MYKIDDVTRAFLFKVGERYPISTIARAIGCSVTTAWRMCKELGISHRKKDKETGKRCLIYRLRKRGYKVVIKDYEYLVYYDEETNRSSVMENNLKKYKIVCQKK